MSNFKPIRPPKLKKDALKSLTMGAVIFLIIVVYSLFDIFSLSFNFNLMTSVSYWAQLGLTTFLLILFIITVRSLRKEHNIRKPVKYKGEDGIWLLKANQLEVFMENLNRGYNKITKAGLSDKLEKYLLKINKEKKFMLYMKVVRNRLEKVRMKIKPEMEKNGVLANKKKTKKLFSEENSLLELQKLTIDDIWWKRFKYKAVTISKLFSSINGKTIDDDETNIDPEEKKGIAKLITTKILWVIVFAAGTGSIIPNFLTSFSWLIIVGIAIKLITILMAANLAIGDADDFTNINLKTSLQRRVRILADFDIANDLGELNLEEIKEVQQNNKVITIEQKPIIQEPIRRTEENIIVENTIIPTEPDKIIIKEIQKI